MKTLPALLAGIALLATLPRASSASESDQYFAWIEGVAESGQALDERLRTVIRRSLRGINQRTILGPRSCEEVALRIATDLGNEAGAMEFLPGSLGNLPTQPGTPWEHARYRRVSYLGPIQFRDFTLMLASAPTLRAHGVLFGIDKLQHLFSTGAIVYRKYLRARERGSSPEHAAAAAADFAIWTENHTLGYRSDGVFSFADIHADLIGLRLLRSWCEGNEPGLVEDPFAGWILSRGFTLAGLLSPYLDEAFNPSVRRPAYYAFTRNRVRAHYCAPLLGEALDSIRSGYEARLSPPDLVIEERIARAIREGDAPDPGPYRLESLCAEEPHKVSHHPAGR
ncbi:MAG: hypothetical protein IT285_06910 [Bdellovibrionales bacterium]|nr:hypothetical protein [Bdellovibrionales bacterium]